MNPQKYYQALSDKDPSYDGVFFFAVKTTGVFCRPVCSARRPNEENCEYFANAQDAMLAGYRPCKKCHPMDLPSAESALVKKLIELVEAEPTKRWSESDLEALGFDSSTVRRHFKKRFGMSFVAYARARRMGLALKNIRGGARVIDAQLDHGFESDSGFRDAFMRIMGAPTSKAPEMVLETKWINTKLGPMVAMADAEHLYLLEFTMRRGLEREVERMRAKLKCAVVPGDNKVLEQIENEVSAYFEGDLKNFKTPYRLIGTPFQTSVWEALMDIPYGQTVNYGDIARAVEKEKAVRGAASAVGANQLAILIPCHRVIGADGSLTGYAGGLERKEWLLGHERAL